MKKLVLLFLLVAIAFSVESSIRSISCFDFEKIEGPIFEIDLPVVSNGQGSLIFVAFLVVILFAGFVILMCAIAFITIFVFISFGVLSSSLVVGLYKKSFSSGFKTLIITSSVLIGPIFGAILFYLLIGSSYFKTETVLIAGAIFGFLLGILFGRLGLIAIRKLLVSLKGKLKD